MNHECWHHNLHNSVPHKIEEVGNLFVLFQSAAFDYYASPTLVAGGMMLFGDSCPVLSCLALFWHHISHVRLYIVMSYLQK